MTAVLTGVARLPCDLQPASDDDKVTLVIWYKDGASSPIYSLDVRGRSLDKATHWADERALGGRAFFQLEESWHLAVENVRESDGGSYRCRVDFKSSPTRNSIVNLSIIVPPRKLVILDENGTNLVQHGRVLGPYVEGTSVQVSCVAYGGRPSPRVSWWLGLDLVDDSDESLSERRVRNVLRLERLERRHLGTILTCTATNNDALPPLNVNVTIDLYLRPLEVRLLGENMPLSASSEYEVACQSTGSRPPAVISWWKAGLMLDHTRETTSSDGNVTTSTLTLAPQVDDSGKSLICRAENRHVADSALEDSWNLNVHYSPIVKLELGSNLNGSSIREGVDVYLECNVQANPWVYKVVWRHNGQPLQNNVSTGIILSNQTLVLQSVNRNISGLYTCVASNSEGDSESNPFNLDVKYEPVCTPGQQKVYGAGRHEEVRVVCDVDANPPAGLFRWSFNNSAVQAGLEVGTVSTEPGGGRSIATYIPASERDYGTLLCWGRNDLGSQTQPCVFHVVPAGKPDSPRNCALVNRTANLVQVVCVKGFDGGLPQEFTMELYSADHRRLISNVTSRSKPEFSVTGLEAGAGYFVSIYSSNGKGRSSAFTLPVSTLKSTQQEPRRTTLATTFPENLPQTVTPVLWVLAGIVVTLGFVGLVAVVVLRLRGCGMDQDSDDGQGTSTASPDSLANEPKSAVGAATIAEAGTGGGASLITVSLQGLKGPVLVTASSTTEEGVEMDDRNPDVIPHTTEVEYPIAVQEYKSYDSLGLDPGGRPIDNIGVAQPTKSISYGNIPHYSHTNTSEAFHFEPQRWQQGMPWPTVIPPQLHPVQKVTAATQTQSAETQTPLMVRHKESAV